MYERWNDRIFNKIKEKGVSLSSAAIILSTVAYSMPADPSFRKPISFMTKKAHQDSEATTQEVRKLIENKATFTQSDEKELEKLLSNRFGLNLKTTLDGNRLNKSIGYIGAEQHLYRWPGDNLSKHNLIQSGIAPNKGAFGYFDTAEQEEYYIAAQIHMLPDWNKNWSRLKPWYRFRKVLVYNPDNGKAVVAVIGDAGPSEYTGKTFGGSPEIMKYLERVDGSQKGKVIVLFIDNADSRVRLGAIGNSEEVVAARNL